MCLGMGFYLSVCLGDAFLSGQWVDLFNFTQAHLLDAVTSGALAFLVIKHTRTFNRQQRCLIAGALFVAIGITANAQIAEGTNLTSLSAATTPVFWGLTGLGGGAVMAMSAIRSWSYALGLVLLMGLFPLTLAEAGFFNFPPRWWAVVGIVFLVGVGLVVNHNRGNRPNAE